MIRGIKLVGLVFGAILALTAVSAASASATELIRFTKTGNFTGKSTTKQVLETKAGRKVECETATAKGKVDTEELALALILFEKCTSTFGSECTSSGSPKGEIHLPHLLVLLGSDEEPPTKDNPAVLLKLSEPESITFECVGLFGAKETVTVTGSVICLVKNNAAKTGVELLCEKGVNKGEQKDKKFWDINQTNVTDTLMTEGKGLENFANEESSQEGNALLEGEPGNTIQIEVT